MRQVRGFAFFVGLFVVLGTSSVWANDGGSRFRAAPQFEGLWMFEVDADGAGPAPAFQALYRLDRGGVLEKMSGFQTIIGNESFGSWRRGESPGTIDIVFFDTIFFFPPPTFPPVTFCLPQNFIWARTAFTMKLDNRDRSVMTNVDGVQQDLVDCDLANIFNEPVTDGPATGTTTATRFSFH